MTEEVGVLERLESTESHATRNMRSVVGLRGRVRRRRGRLYGVSGDQRSHGVYGSLTIASAAVSFLGSLAIDNARAASRVLSTPLTSRVGAHHEYARGGRSRKGCRGHFEPQPSAALR